MRSLDRDIFDRPIMIVSNYLWDWWEHIGTLYFKSLSKGLIIICFQLRSFVAVTPLDLTGLTVLPGQNQRPESPRTLAAYAREPLENILKISSKHDNSPNAVINKVISKENELDLIFLGIIQE